MKCTWSLNCKCGWGTVASLPKCKWMEEHEEEEHGKCEGHFCTKILQDVECK